MKIFISYRYTGEDRSTLNHILSEIVSILEKKGHQVFCSFFLDNLFKEKKFSKRDILDHALRELDSSDYILAVIRSTEKSEGMLLELGYAYAKNKKIILVVKDNVQTNFLSEITTQNITFNLLDELYIKINNLILDIE